MTYYASPAVAPEVVKSVRHQLLDADDAKIGRVMALLNRAKVANFSLVYDGLPGSPPSATRLGAERIGPAFGERRATTPATLPRPRRCWRRCARAWRR